MTEQIAFLWGRGRFFFSIFNRLSRISFARFIFPPLKYIYISWLLTDVVCIYREKPSSCTLKLHSIVLASWHFDLLARYIHCCIWCRPSLRGPNICVLYKGGAGFFLDCMVFHAIFNCHHLLRITHRLLLLRVRGASSGKRQHMQGTRFSQRTEL